MELREVLTALRRSWWMLLFGLLIGGGAAYGYCFLQTPLYTSSTQLFVSTTDTSSPAAAVQGSQLSQERVASYAELLTGRELARRVIARLGLHLSPSQLAEEVTAAPVANTVLIDVSVTDRSPERAESIADALGSEFTRYVGDLEATGPQGSLVKVTVTQFPQFPSTPSSPRTKRYTALGMVAGLLVGAAAGIARARVDRTLKDPDQLVALVGAPVLGTVLRSRELEKKHHVTERNSTGRAAEDFRQLRLNLQFVDVDDPPKVIMISSALPSEGKTTLVVNLALVLAEAGRRVTILEADLRRPKVTRYLNLLGGPGLTNILTRTADIEDVTQTFREGVSVIGTGPLPPNPGELLASGHMADVVEKLRGENDYVLVDAPPLLPVADARALAVVLDGVLLCVRYGKTRKEQVRQAAGTLDRVGAKKLGVILNVVPRRTEVAATYGYNDR